MTTPAPESYTPAYCDAIREGCIESRLTTIKQIDEVHEAIFKPGGICDALPKKISFAAAKWWLSLLLVPAIIAGLTAYQFMSTAPLTYADRETVEEVEKRLTVVEVEVERAIKSLTLLPTKDELREIITEALNK